MLLLFNVELIFPFFIISYLFIVHICPISIYKIININEKKNIEIITKMCFSLEDSYNIEKKRIIWIVLNVSPFRNAFIIRKEINTKVIIQKIYTNIVSYNL